MRIRKTEPEKSQIVKPDWLDVESLVNVNSELVNRYK